MRPADKRVLLVDDDPGVWASIRRVLEDTGYEVAIAADGEEALRQFAPGHIDLVLLDLDLPIRGGWDVFERVTTCCPLVPIIIITGLPNQHQVATAAGVGALIEKPIEVSTLLQTMKELLAEPNEARLRRMCGYQYDTRLLRSTRPARDSRELAVKSRQHSSSRRSIPNRED